ncbi:hypothetical protein ACQ1PR_10905, partial [Ornithobacterium rhinotracheale]|uniref:hypothetical protein n=1 Tax=Ornithobacterium rhinotracheale TaxID=28251 RepID=UPI0039FC0A52
EKQIKYINKMFSVNVKECDDLLNIVHALDEDLFKDRKHLDAYFSFFIEPFYDDICTKGDVFGYQMKLKRFIDGE